MPDITAIVLRPRTVRAPGYNAVVRAYASHASDPNGDNAERSHTKPAVGRRYVQTLTYNGHGRLVESLMPPIINVRT
jgi:hypothetical protein